jgi:hypothetical protein
LADFTQTNLVCGTLGGNLRQEAAMTSIHLQVWIDAPLATSRLKCFLGQRRGSEPLVDTAPAIGHHRRHRDQPQPGSPAMAAVALKVPEIIPERCIRWR